MKKSAGVLVYKKEKNEIKVLLCHMGGPFWEENDLGGWCIPKGEIQNEKTIDTAIREFNEETGFIIEKTKLEFLASKKQLSRKLDVIFMATNDYDASKAFSNTFKREYPKGSGVICEFPEMDMADWIELQEAKKKILKGQRYFLEKLEQRIEK